MKDFKHIGTCWRDNKAGHKHFRRFLECCDENSFLWVIKKPGRRGGVPDLALTSLERLVGNVKLKNGFGCGHYEMVVFKILVAVRRAHSKLTADFRRTEFGLLCLVVSHGIESWRGTEDQENWLVFRDHLPETYEWCIPSKRSWAKMTRWLHGWTQSVEKRSTKRKPTEIGNKYKHPGGIQRDFPSRQES